MTTTIPLASLGLEPDDGLVLDFDGTLAPIVDDPDAASLPDGAAAVLVDLAAMLGGAVAILSGRDVRDLATRVPRGLWRAGGHGLEVIAPNAPVPEPPAAADAAITARLDPLSADWPGVRIEIKGPVIAIHYRAVPDAANAVLNAATAAAQRVPDHVVQPGKMVVEVKPKHANKGAALGQLFNHPPFEGRRPIMIGDDTTDEDAMRMAQSLGGLGVKIGPGETVARVRGSDPAVLHRWLRTQRPV